MVTSDSGLIGGLNVQAMNMAMKEARTTGAKLIVIGERGRLYAADSGIPFVSFKGVQDETRLAQAQQLRDYIMEQESALKLGGLRLFSPGLFYRLPAGADFSPCFLFPRPAFLRLRPPPEWVWI